MVVNAWLNLAKDETFAGLTLTQYQQKLTDLNTRRLLINNQQVQYIAASKDLDTMYQDLNDITLAVVDGVKASVPKFGPDSGLYKTMGYVPKSERASGLVRKSTTTATSGSVTSATVPTAPTSGSLHS